MTKSKINEKETFKKINENLSSLYDISEKINNNTKGKIERIKENLDFDNYNNGILTGMANDINKEKTPLFEDILLKTTTKESADSFGKNFASFFNLSEAFNLYMVASKGNNPEYVRQNGKLYNSIYDIDSSKYNIQEIKRRIIEETGGKLEDCKVLILRPDSSMAWKIKSSFALHDFLNKNLKILTEKGGLPDQTMEFTNLDADLYNSLHGVLIKNIKLNDKIISFRIEDFYNFNNGRKSLRGRVGEKLQNKNDLENYYIIIEIFFGKPKI